MTLAPAAVGTYRTKALGTRAEILTTDPDAVDAAAIVLDSELQWIDLLASRFRPDSELSRLNATGGRSVEVSTDLAEVVGVSLRAARLTGGAVTPMVGRALVELGYDRDFAALPADRPGPLPPAVPVPRWEAVEMDRSARTLRVPAGAQLDLGATAKAWAADRIAALAASRLGCGVLVSLGGDVAMAGEPPPAGWVVGVADRCEAGHEDADQVVVLREGGVATSGTAGRVWRRDGRLVHHLVDPTTGRSVSSCWRTASVAAGTCVDANIAATAAMVIGRGGPEWLAERGLPARLVDTSGSVTLVAGWPAEGETDVDRLVAGPSPQ